MSIKQGKQTYINDRKVYIKETAAIVGPREKPVRSASISTKYSKRTTTRRRGKKRKQNLQMPHFKS